MSELEEIAKFAVELAERAGRRVLERFDTHTVELKSDGTEVTDADRDAESFIRDELARAHPRAPVLGEEFGGVAEPIPGDQWIVDPVDGTTSFVLGLPLFGTLIGLLRDRRPVVGVVHLPAMSQTLWAWDGGGCHLSREGSPPVRVASDSGARLADAFVSASGVHSTELDRSASGPRYRLEPLVSAARKFRVVNDCVQHALVCQGRLHVAIDAVMEPWDSAALIPCVREAGGEASSLEGDRENVVFARSLVSAASDALLTEVLSVIDAG